MTRTEDIKQTVLDYVEAINSGDYQLLHELFAPDARIQGVTGAGGLEFALPIWKQLYAGLNMRLEVQEMIAEGDSVAVRYREHGRWTGPFLDFTEPTGRAYELVALEWFEVKNGKIISRWAARDAASQARQVGFPTAAGPTSNAERAA